MRRNRYPAKAHYQQSQVADQYDSERFSSWHGKLAHKMEHLALKYAIDHFFPKGGTLLDVPCGTGRLLELYRGGTFRVFSADISEEMLSIARRRFAGDPTFSFHQCDVERLPFRDNALDYLVSFRLMCHLPKDIRRTVLSEMLRVTSDILAVNYHFDVNTPLMWFNKIFRADTCPTYPLSRADFRDEISGMNLEVCDMKTLSWYERSSTLVIMKKKGSTFSRR